MRNLTRGMAAILALALPAYAAAAGDAAKGREKAAVCIACHGADGNSLADMWPKLAGQVPDYILKQLRDFKAGRRQDEQMSPMAANVAAADMEDIAAYFAAQAVAATPAEKADLALGERIYLEGKGRPQPVAACIGCHGPGGAGNRDWAKTLSRPPAVLAPAIGGQHAAYLRKQLAAFRAGARDNDVARVMRHVAAALDDREIAAVAAYTATLGR